MVARTTADDIADALAEATRSVVDAFHADQYQIIRSTRVSDGRGGSTSTDAVAEVGRCQLIVENTGGFEGAQGNAVGATTLYTVVLPRLSIARASDQITVNGRPFQIRAIREPGGIALQVITAELEERT